MKLEIMQGVGLLAYERCQCDDISEALGRWDTLAPEERSPRCCDDVRSCKVHILLPRLLLI